VEERGKISVKELFFSAIFALKTSEFIALLEDLKLASDKIAVSASLSSNA